MSVHSQGFTKDLAKMGGRVGREGEGYSQTQVSVTWGGRPPVRQSCRNVGPWMRDARRRAGWSLVPCRTARLRSSSAPTHASPAKPSHSTALSSSTFTLQQPIPNTRCVSKHTHTSYIKKLKPYCEHSTINKCIAVYPAITKLISNQTLR